MKNLTCGACGSTDFIKQDDVLLCQACGMKYTGEENLENWEPLFRSVAIKVCMPEEISSIATNLQCCLDKVFESIKTTVDNETEKKKVVKEIVDECNIVAKSLTKVSNDWLLSVWGKSNIFSWFYKILQGKQKIKMHFVRCFNIAEIMRSCGDCIEKHFDMNDDNFKELAVYSWKSMIDLNSKYASMRKDSLYSSDILAQYAAKINKYASGY